MSLSDVPLTREFLANVAAVISILTVLFASPLLFGAYVVVQRSRALTHYVWFALVLGMLAGAFITGLLGLFLLG